MLMEILEGSGTMMEKFEYLQQLDTESTKHSGRTLWTHLTGVYDLLVSWNCHPHVCDAGLYHSVYGTTYFKKQTVSLEDRDKVKLIIGNDAELLAYLFCTTDHPRFYNFAQMENTRLRDELVLIDYANMKEMDSSWDNQDYHPYLPTGIIVRSERDSLDYYSGRV